MPDYISWIIFVGGVSIFIASLFQVRQYFRFRQASRKWIWNLDPESQARVVQERVQFLEARGQDGGDKEAEVASALNDPAYREELARRYEELASSLRHARS